MTDRNAYSARVGCTDDGNELETRMHNPETSSRSLAASTSRPDEQRRDGGLEAEAEALVDRLMGRARSGGTWEDHARELLIAGVLHVCGTIGRSSWSSLRVVHQLLAQPDHLEVMLACESGPLHPRVGRTSKALRAAATKDRAIVQIVAMAYLKRWMANQRMAGRGRRPAASEREFRVSVREPVAEARFVGSAARLNTAVPASVGTTRTLVATHAGDPDAVSIRMMPDPLFGPKRKRVPRAQGRSLKCAARGPLSARSKRVADLHDVLSFDEDFGKRLHG